MGCGKKKKKEGEDEGEGKCVLSPNTMKLITLITLLVSDFDVVFTGKLSALKYFTFLKVCAPPSFPCLARASYSSGRIQCHELHPLILCLSCLAQFSRLCLTPRQVVFSIFSTAPLASSSSSISVGASSLPGSRASFSSVSSTR